jgi:hypothetical protein
LDETRILQWKMREGTTYDTFRSMVAGRLNGLNAELMTAWGDMMFVTPMDYLEYPNGGAVTDFPEITEYDLADLYKGATIGHMIDLKAYGKGVGGTWRYFKRTRQGIIQATLGDIVQSGRNSFEKKLLTRAMTNSENLLGTAGYDVGFCRGTGGSLTYTPPAVGGETFLNTHTHFNGFDSGSGKTFADVLDGIAEHLLEHGHPPPYKVKVSTADVTTYQALTNFGKPISDRIVIVDRGAASSGAQFFERSSIETPPQSGAGYYIGSYVSSHGELMLYATARISTGYAFGYKSYGVNDARNPIAVRVDPDQGFGLWINEIASNNNKFPVARIQIELEYGISCGNDRTVGANALLVAGGAWANPTIS